jgi:FkbH-like protein
VNSKLTWNAQHGLLTFVFNFMTPQFAAMGRFVPRFDLRNPAFFVRQLNQELETLVGGFRNAHILDLDGLAASFGRRYVQDDVYTNFGHNATLGAELPKLDRLEKVPPLGDFLDIEPGRHFKAAIASELRAMLRSVRQIDAIKLVVVDLDDTLWNGVSGDTAEAGPHMIEGWPIGFAEVLLYLRKRGVLLAIASKNDEARIHAIWRPIFGGRLKLEDFAAVRINWRPKIENMAEILSAMNLLPRNVLFIDDNPVERAAMQAAFPEIRLLGSNPYELRRILFNAAELQGVSITQESAARTEMIQAQMQRETERAALSPDDFAREQNTTVKLAFLTSVDHSRFPRALELINKTNQFNTTGRRWKAEECAAFFKAKGVFAVFDVEDRFTPYGLVGVVILAGGAMLQWVMSCRVIGMRVEQAVMAALVAQLRAAGQSEITAVLIRTDVNQPCQSLFADAGFAHTEKIWKLPPDRAPAMPAYIRLETATPMLPAVA